MSKKKATNRKRGAVIRSTVGLSGVELIKRERARQMSEEGWTPKHDDRHKHGEMAFAGAAYARVSGQIAIHGANKVALSAEPLAWPWGEKWWKPSEDQVRNLVKAGALIAAEIDRLQRKQARSKSPANERVRKHRRAVWRFVVQLR